MDFLTENDIKHAALRFLKSHYKYRPRIGDSQARIDNITKSGIIADGLLTFQTDITNKFEATVEATSYAKAHEVKYKVRNSLLWWDAITFSFIITTLLCTFFYFRKTFNVGAEYIVHAVLFILVTLFFFTLLYRLLLRGITTYRQIYALEQFKLYDADEQWVAVGVDVFEHPDDKYLKELKRQCVLNGFGLMIVDKDLEIRQSITPSQFPMEGKKRKEAQFKALDEETDGASSDLSGRIRNYTESIATSLGWEKESRFRNDYTVQILILMICSTLMGLMLWSESRKTKEDVLNNNSYRNQMERKKAELEREGNFYLIDEGEVVGNDTTVAEYDLGELKFYDEEEVARWYDKHHQDSLYDALDGQSKQSGAEILDSLNKELEKDSFKAPPPPVTSTQPPKPRPKFDPICKDYVNWYGRRFILKDGVYKSRKTAEDRLSQINKASAMGGILRGGCFKESRPYYIVYVDVVYTNRDKAQTWLPYFNQLLKDKGYSSGELEMMTVTVKR